jgi:hypothetical protein
VVWRGVAWRGAAGGQVIVPDKLDPAHMDTGFLWITGGDNNPNSLPTNPTDEDPLVTASVCVANGVVGAALFQIPNQPLYFADELPTPRGRTEDAMVAWTWKHFIEDPCMPPPSPLASPRVARVRCLMCVGWAGLWVWWWWLVVVFSQARVVGASAYDQSVCARAGHTRGVPRAAPDSDEVRNRRRVEARLDHVDHRRCGQARRHVPAHRHG